jgi:hypothetical protein
MRKAKTYRAGDITLTNHVRSTLGDLSAFKAHGDANVGTLQRGGIVHAIAGHGADPPLALQ